MLWVRWENLTHQRRHRRKWIVKAGNSMGTLHGRERQAMAVRASKRGPGQVPQELTKVRMQQWEPRRCRGAGGETLVGLWMVGRLARMKGVWQLRD